MLRLGYYFKVLSKEFDNKKSKAVERLNLTAQQMNIIFYLSKNEDKCINQKCIEEEFQLSSATVSGILKRLELKEYIIRKTNPLNLKEKYIYLSKQGHLAKNEVIKEFDKLEELLLNGFSEHDVLDLRSYLDKILANMKGEELKHD